MASDAISLKVYPPKESYLHNGERMDVPGVFLHKCLIAGWGMPVGELFDLEELSRICQEDLLLHHR